MPPAHQECQQTHKRGNMQGSAGETCHPKRWLAGEKSEYKSTLPILVDTTDRRRTHCVRPTQLWWAAAREPIESFAEETKKKIRHTRHARISPGQATPTSHKERRQAKKKSKPQFPGSKGNAGNARLPPAHQERQQTHEKRQHARDCWRDLPPPKKVAGR